MESWIDALWRDNEPGTTIIGKNSRLDRDERKILLAFAQGGDLKAAAEAVGEPLSTFSGGTLMRLRAKLHAQATPRLVKLAYETGALTVEFPNGVVPAPVLPENYGRTLELIADGHGNPAIAKELGMSEGRQRAVVRDLAVGFTVEWGIGGRSQLVARMYEFGIAPLPQSATRL